MMRLPFAACALLCALSAPGQVSVRESSIRARLVDGKTNVSLALSNRAPKPLEAIVSAEWLGPGDEKHGHARVTATLASGDSAVDFPLPLPPARDPLLERLRYEVWPAGGNLTGFLPVTGAVSFTHIAEHSFSLSAIMAGPARRGKPYEVRVLARHPLTGRPREGVEVRCGKSASATTEADGVALLRVQPDEFEEDEALQIEGRLGDYRQTSETRGVPVAKDEVRIYTDKPLYQPGQTMHVRILSLGGAGAARPDVEHEIRIENDDGDIVHTANVTTSRFGVASKDWEIPPHAKSGDYRIEVETDDLDEAAHRTVQIRSYELPSFRVVVKPDRAFYLPGQQAVLEVRGEYLFGKPVHPAGARIADQDGKPVAEGRIDAEGRFRATVVLDADLDQHTRFVDRRFTAFVTDDSTNRTEQGRFDVRVSRDALHVYVVRQEYTANGLRLYVSTYSPAGSPAAADVEVASLGRMLARGRSSRYGVARVDVPGGEYDDIELRANANGAAGRTPLSLSRERPEIGLETDRALYRRGERIECRIWSSAKRGAALLLAWTRMGEVVFSQSVTFNDGAASVAIPYNARFGSELAIGVASGESAASRRVVFMGAKEFAVQAVPGRQSYRPGETALIQFRTPVESALGIAIVDESVLERSATDQAFGQRRWLFNSGSHRGGSLAGLEASDLPNLDPAQIDADMQVVAAALLPDPTLIHSTDDPIERLRADFARAGSKLLTPLLASLNQHYLRTLDYPRDETELAAILGKEYTTRRDPWMKPFYATFRTDRSQDWIEIMSEGPDKQRDTEDDYVVAAMSYPWFGKAGGLIGEALEKLVDYPATRDEFLRLVDEAGVRFTALRDPWGSPMDVVILHHRERRLIAIRSAGPDRKAGTRDDFTVVTYAGSYFGKVGTAVETALAAATEFPRTTEQLREVLRQAGIDVDALRDPWNRPYYAAFRVEEQFSDRIRFYTYEEYAGTPEQRKQITPVKRKVLIAQIRSAGEDGVIGTYDDFAAAAGRRSLEDGADPEPVERLAPAPLVPGTGALEGVVTDVTGAVIPNVEVTLNDVYVERTDERGEYRFSGLKAAGYRLRFNSPGFQTRIVDRIPVRADRVTTVDVVLQVGAVSESVEVNAEPPGLETSSASVAMAAQAAVSTRRVREYFPETLYWNPELVTDGSGRASINVKLADSITTWRVAVIASTADGRIAETSTTFRAFQPFMADLDVPAFLTVGDEIALPVPVRNYLDNEQEVAVSFATPKQIPLNGAVRQPGRIAASSQAAAVLPLKADSPVKEARIRVVAVGGKASDAIEKALSIRPHGERKSTVVSGIVRDRLPLRVEIPKTAIEGSIRAEVTFYPSLTARIIEAADGLLTRPTGCGEQVVSSTYPNVLFLKAARKAGVDFPKLSQKAMKHVTDGYQRLLRYQDATGGFMYWARREPDAALTAYALRFLGDASEFIEVDPARLERARQWLARQSPEAESSAALRLLALGRGHGDVDRQLGELARRAALLSEDPYPAAVFALAAMEAGKKELAQPAIEQLLNMAQDERGAAFWSLRANTPFHGWGRAGQVETTALAVSALARWRALASGNAELDALIDRGVLFLLKNVDSAGAWSSTQATVRSLEAMLELWSAGAEPKAQSVDVLVNGAKAGTARLPAGNLSTGPVTLDVSRFIRPDRVHEVSIMGALQPAEVQVKAEWFEPWGEPKTSGNLSFERRCGPGRVQVNETVTCEVGAARTAFRGYGMLIAEVGLPPGAEVDRGVLAGLVADPANGVDSFEVSTDRVTFYLWPRAAEARFRFVFRPRFAMRARAAQSVLYDYYNPDERVVLAPGLFVAE